MSGKKLVKRLHAGVLTLPEGLLVAAIYATTCWVARQVSLDQFLLPSGIRIAALLLSPVRIWPYLLLGDYLYLGQLRIPMLDKYGAEWVLISSAYQLPTAAAVVHLSRHLVANKSDTWLLSIAAASALLIGIGNLAFAYLLWPSPPSGGFLNLASRYVLGHYIATMTIAPLALLWKWRRDIDWSSWRNPTAIYAAVSFLTCGVVSTLIPHEAATEKATIQLLMAAPVVALTCIQGWWGAAIAMPMMNIFIRINTPSSGLAESFDPDSFKIQLTIAISGTALLALGSKITHYYRKYSHHSKARRQAMSNARSSHITSERELRNHALSLRRLGDGLDASLSGTVDWLRARGHTDMASSLLLVATVHSRNFREQASMVYPATVEQVGLYLALQTGGISEAWDKTDRLAPPRFVGDPCRLSLDLQLTAYRALAETVSLLLENERGLLEIKARCGWFGSARGILITVGTVDKRHRLSRSTATMAVGRLSGRTQAYGGTVQCRRNRIRLSFADPSTC